MSRLRLSESAIAPTMTHHFCPVDMSFQSSVESFYPASFLLECRESHHLLILSLILGPGSLNPMLSRER